MTNNFNSKDVVSELENHIRKFAIQYGSAYIKCAIIKKENELYLYLADIKIQHKDDKPITETVHEYENIIFATIPLTIKELGKIIVELNSGKINLSSLKEINVKNGFNETYHHVSSRTYHAGFYYEWPCYCFRTSLNRDVIMSDMHSPLIKLGLPSYPSSYDACDVFFQHEFASNQPSPISINFLIPNYDARIKTLEIADKRISIIIEDRETPLDDLSVQIFCKTTNIESQNSQDLKPDASGTARFTANFVPNTVFACLLNSKTGKIIDSKMFSPHFFPRTEGIVVKTSVGNLNTMIAEGENQQVEFKRDLDKESKEFLESVVGFANTNDGAILLGVDDDGKVIGFFDDFDKIDKKIHGTISGRCEPDIEVNIEQIHLEGKPIIVIKVKEGKNKPYLLTGKSAYKRVDKSEHVFKRLDFDKIFNEKQAPNRSSDFIK